MLYPFGNPQAATFPDDFISPELKDKAWHTRYVQAAYYTLSQNTYFNSIFDNVTLNEMFAHGKQPIDRYIPQLTGNEKNGDVGANYMNINWRQVSMLPVIRDIALGYLEKVDYGIQCQAINPQAIDEKEQIKWNLWAQKELFDETKRYAELLGGEVPITPDVDLGWIPNTLSEFETVSQWKIKLKEEIQAELGSEAVLDMNEWKLQERLLLESFIDNAIGATETRINKYTGLIETKAIPMSNLLLPSFTGKTGEKVWIAGVIEPVTVYDIYREAGEQLSPQEYQQIATRYTGVLNNSMTNLPMNMNFSEGMDWSLWRNFNVYRVRFYWFSTDVTKLTKVERNGTETLYKSKSGNREAKEVEKNGYKIKIAPVDLYKQCVHECSWILGTDIVYNWGKVNSFSKDQLNKRECMLPIRVYTTGRQSRVERCIPFIDQMSLAFYRLQNTIARGVPSGISIDLAAMERVLFDGKQMDAREWLNLVTQTGLRLWRSNDTMYEDRGGKAISEENATWMAEVQAYEAQIAFNMDMIRRLMGVNEYMDASTPDSREAVNNVKISYESALNGFSDIVNGIIYLKEKNVIDIAGKLQRATMLGVNKIYSRQVGRWIEFENSFSLTQLGVKVYQQPLQKEKERLIMQLEKAMLDPDIMLDYDDYFTLQNLIKSTASTKFAESEVIRIISNRRRERQEMQQQIVQAQSEAQAKTAREMFAMEQQKLAMQLEVNNAEYTHKTNEDIRKAQALGAIKAENSVVKGEIDKDKQQNKVMLDAMVGK